jgi:hypothetical protein
MRDQFSIGLPDLNLAPNSKASGLMILVPKWIQLNLARQDRKSMRWKHVGFHAIVSIIFSDQIMGAPFPEPRRQAGAR